MGASRWSDDHYYDRKELYRSSGTPMFEYDAAVKSTPSSEHKAHEAMNPRDVKVRESRDSAEHPDSLAIAVLFDVTGSMREVPSILQENLPKLMGLLMRKGYVDHPQIMVGAIGDATCDRVPLQIGQYESGIEIDHDLSKLYLEGGGGASYNESYELGIYFLARHTAIDCFEKRNRKGYCFIIGDELPYDEINKGLVQKVIGDTLQSNISTKEMLAELSQKYEVFFVIPQMTAHWKDTNIINGWKRLVGQNFLELEDPAGICELIASTIGLSEKAISLDDISKDLIDSGSSSTVANSVTKALATVASSESRGLAASVPDSGATSGITSL